MLIGALVTDAFAFVFLGHDANVAGIDEGSLDVAHERAGGDVLVREVLDRPDDNGGILAFVAHEGHEPRLGKSVGNHFFGHKTAIGVVPVAGQVNGLARIHPRNDFAAGTAERQNQNGGHQQCDG